MDYRCSRVSVCAHTGSLLALFVVNIYAVQPRVSRRKASAFDFPGLYLYSVKG